MLIRVRSRVLQLPRGLLNDYVQTLEGLALWPAAFVNHPEKEYHQKIMTLYTKGLTMFGTQYNFFSGYALVLLWANPVAESVAGLKKKLKNFRAYQKALYKSEPIRAEEMEKEFETS